MPAMSGSLLETSDLREARDYKTTFGTSLNFLRSSGKLSGCSVMLHTVITYSKFIGMTAPLTP